jgi:nucleoside-diphosphate-sugar epimerase
LDRHAERISFVQGNIDDWANVVGAVNEFKPDSIIHIAAIVNPVTLSRRPGLALSVNVGGTLNVLEAARLFKVGRVIYFSSIGVLPSIRYEPVDLDHPVLLATEGPGASFYGAAKLSGEAFCWAYHQSFDLDFMILRPSAVYGFGMQWPLFIKPMVENAVRGLPTSFAQGREFPRDYTHAADVAQLALLALDVPREHVHDRIFYGATGQALVTAGEVAEIVTEQIPSAEIAIGSGLSEADLVEIRYRGVLSIQNSQAQLGYTPRFADIRVGVSDYIATYRRYLAESGSQTHAG